MSGKGDQAALPIAPQRGPGRFFLGFLLGLFAGGLIAASYRGTGSRSGAEPELIGRAGQSGRTVESSMDEVLQIARDALVHLYRNVDDYTATLVQQETTAGRLSEPHEISLKVHCRHRGPNRDDSEPFRVYLRFERPASVAGREVIYAEDKYDGKLVVHEAGLLGLLTVYLDPTVMVAMRGQRYPIYEIGLTNLVKKLIERGEEDRTNPDVTVTITRDWELDGQRCDLIVVRRGQPTGQPDDFSRAEICFDRERHLPLRYAAYGWPAGSLQTADPADAPLMDTYPYLNVKTHVGLTESDVDHKNPDYQIR